MGENGASVLADVPAEMAPAELKLEEAVRILQNRKEGPRVLGNDPATGLPVYVMDGRYGAYVQVGETPEDKKAPKPRRASLEGNQRPDTITLEEALALLAFPRTLGTHPETGEPVLANKGKFGPYVQHQKDFRSLKKDDNPATITLARALELLAQPKAVRGQKSVLKDLGNGIQVLDGRHGPYVTNGELNANVPDSLVPEELTVEQAMELLKERAANAAGKTKVVAAKRGAAKKPAGGKATGAKAKTTGKPRKSPGGGKAK
jgi:DNA topoisomerase-1